MENQTTNEVSMPKQFFQDTVKVLTEPVSFFSTRFHEMSFNHSLVFGIILSWIAAFLDWITRAIKHESIMDGFIKFKNQLSGLPVWKDLPEDIWNQGEQVNTLLPAWGLEGLRMLINPFHSLFTFFAYGVIFWLGAMLLVSKDNPTKNSVTITNVIKITAIASTTSIVTSILSFLPFGFGSFLGWIYHTVILTIGFSVSFQISRLRGLAVIFFPTIATIVVASCFVGVIIALFAGLIASIFH